MFVKLVQFAKAPSPRERSEVLLKSSVVKAMSLVNAYAPNEERFEANVTEVNVALSLQAYSWMF